ncbi:MAG: DUF2784 domain-containing protein [Bryobacteraceae bacterium]
MNPFAAAAAAVLCIHLAWILWTIFGAFVTRGRRFLTGFHLASLAWGIIVEVGPWPCPLTLLEGYLEFRAGLQPIQGSFIVHYLDAIVYPNLPVMLLVWIGVAVCAFNLGLYVRRFWKWQRTRLRL